VWYWAATLPRLVRHGDPAGAAQDDIGQSLASTRRKSSSFTSRSFHVAVAIVELFATTNETWFALAGTLADGLLHRCSPMKHRLKPGPGPWRDCFGLARVSNDHGFLTLD
jgi:hypothetical protein